MVGELATGQGTVIVRGAGSNWNLGPTGGIAVGLERDRISDGCARGRCDQRRPHQRRRSSARSSVLVLLTDGGSAWTVGNLFVGGDMVLAGGTGTVTVQTVGDARR